VPPNTLLHPESWLTLFEQHLDPSGTEMKLEPFTHIFTHFKLKILASVFHMKEIPEGLDFKLEAVKLYNLNQYALPAPFEKLLGKLFIPKDTSYDSQDHSMHTAQKRFTFA
jgi:adenine-specific DNA glycosylase